MRSPRYKWRTIIESIRILGWARLNWFFKGFIQHPILEDRFFEFWELRFSFGEGEGHKKTHKINCVLRLGWWIGWIVDWQDGFSIQLFHDSTLPLRTRDYHRKRYLICLRHVQWTEGSTLKWIGWIVDWLDSFSIPLFHFSTIPPFLPSAHPVIAGVRADSESILFEIRLQEIDYSSLVAYPIFHFFISRSIWSAHGRTFSKWFQKASWWCLCTVWVSSWTMI